MNNINNQYSLQISKAITANQHTIWLYRWGWVSLCFGIINFVLFIIAVLWIALKPPVIVTIDNEGRISGTVEYLNASVRSDEEILLGLRQFLSAKMSLNRDTIFSDMSFALTMMSPELIEQELAILKKQESIERIQQSPARSYLSFESSTILERKNNHVTAELTGNLFIGTNPYPFRVRITGLIVPRTKINTFGFQIQQYEDLGE
ncbi:MAG: hypothetical protein QM538_02575 [Methylacidiphilales bacterium]|nr:hypothetical protein [Candidatus Methylacidiphilales bacterium]